VDENSNNEELEQILKKMLESGQFDPEAFSKIAGIGNNPAQIGQIFSQFRSMMKHSDEPVNWDLAIEQAKVIAQKGELQPSASFQSELNNAFDMAALWLGEETSFSNSQSPKSLTRSLWVQDSMPLYKDLSEPVAASMAKALSENLGNLMPEQFSEMLGPAAQFLGNAGATIFAMQLGQAAGNLSTSALSSSEIGIPLSSRPGLVPQNVEEFLKDLETPKSEVLIFLCVRELALSYLYNSNRWLREQLITQVREFAAGLRVDTSGLQELAESIDLSDPDSIKELMAGGNLVTSRTPEQEIALSRIETLLALIEGFADAISLRAARRLPNIATVSEIFRRRRASNGPAEKTFALLLGLEIRPRLVREASNMWEKVFENRGLAGQDLLWSHPDQLPSAEEIQDPNLLIKRLGQGTDDFDGELRKLLGD
jgi:putative hydrolase